jgi:SWIM zinc finger
MLRLYFGDSVNMPDCQCFDWSTYHWPCKHILAIFINTSHSWNDLSPLYRDSPYFSIDDDIIITGVVPPMISPNTASAGLTNDSNNSSLGHAVEHAVISPIDESSLPVTGTSVRIIATNCRQVLRQLLDATYLCSDVTALTVLECDLIKSYQKMLHQTPHDKGLALNAKIPTRASRSTSLAKRRQMYATRKYSQVFGSGDEKLFFFA